MIRGERLTDVTRNDFVNRGASIFRQRQKVQAVNVAEHTRLARARGLDPANVIIERALTLSLQYDLLMKGFANTIKALDRQYGLFNNGWLTPFFS